MVFLHYLIYQDYCLILLGGQFIVKKNCIQGILQQLNNLKILYNRPKSKNCLEICLKFCVCAVWASILIPFTYRLIAVGNNSPKTDAERQWITKCKMLSLVLKVNQHNEVVNAISDLLPQHLDWSINYAIAMLYYFFCKEIQQIISILCSNQRNFDSVNIWNQYSDIRKCIKQVEKRFSLPIFLFMCRSFVEFFRVLSFLFNKLNVKVDVRYGLITALHSCVILFVFISVVVSANTLLNTYKKLCVKMLQIPKEMYYTTKDFEVYRNCMLLMDDKKNMTLTGWGMFHMKKNLFTTAIASLISYGVILHQFH